MMLQRLKLLFDRLWAALACPGGVHYVSGAQSLPPPLTPEEEKQLLARMMQATLPPGMSSSPTTCGWWSTWPKSTRAAGCRRRI